MTKKIFIGIIENQKYTIEIDNYHSKYLYSIIFNNEKISVNACIISSQIISIIINNNVFDINLNCKNKLFESYDEKISANINGKTIQLEIFNKKQNEIKKLQSQKFLDNKNFKVNSTMNGKVLRYLVKTGEAVKKGQGLVIVEAMKMENELQSPKNGIIKKTIGHVGKSIQKNETLIVFE